MFLTGAPRCGSSWAGQALSAAIGARYIYEPFNPQWAPALKGRSGHFRYLGANASPRSEIVTAADRAFAGQQGLKQWARAAYRGYLGNAMTGRARVLVKDPTACLMAEWLARHYPIRVGIIFRHPCGFASSLSQLEWDFRVDRLLSQPGLLRKHLSRHEQLLRQAGKDPWLRKGAFWGALHHVFLAQSMDHPDWVLWPYESLCAEPEAQFQALARSLDFDVDDNALRRALPSVRHNSPDSGSTRRHSQSMPASWRKRLSAAAIDAVEGIAREFVPRGALAARSPTTAIHSDSW
ncbi:hypothetical protein [Marinihelvus fidelis]|uniref:hypothetical protein n=1 Tax=Marinihelvus fidelis TaxID=2613842 RepID=UPI0017847D47|nr:hypothetical protein [Marinihelvus fidelis]